MNRNVPALRAHVRAPHEFTRRDLQAWAELEARAVEPNAYLSPHHVLPAARYLDAHDPPIVVSVERGNETIGIGVFRQQGAQRSLPFPHLIGYRSRHTYLSGLLLDRAHADTARHALIDHVRRAIPACGGLHFTSTWADGAVASGVASGVLAGGAINVHPLRHQRAVLRPAQTDAAAIAAALGKRVKDLDRRMRRLRERGSVGWRVVRGDRAAIAASAEAFLTLEHAGWKGEERSSLRSNPADEAFFRATVDGFAREGRAHFCELTLDGQPIASICNFVSGRIGFGFKIGWDPQFKAHSPGVLNEVELMRHASTSFPEIDLFDSGAGPDAEIAKLWPARRSLANVSVPVRPLARLAVGSQAAARALKRRIERGTVQALTWQAARHDVLAVATTHLAEITEYL